MEHMAAAAPASTWEQLVVKAMREGNAGLLSCVRGMHLPLPTRQQVQQWAEYTTEVVVGAGRKRSPEAPSRAEESVSPSSRSAGMRRAAGSSIRRQALNAAASSAAEGVFPYADSNDVNDGAAEASSVNSERAREAMPISWKRVGMIAAYREMAVHQFRASWVALLNSSVSIVMAYYYLPLILEAFLWLQCVTFEMRSNQYRSEITIPMRGATVRCDSAEYQVMRRLAIAMLVVYGFCYPLGHIVVSLILQRRYGVDVTYASLPVIFFGDSTFDYLISIGYLLTKLIAVIAVTQAASPMLQMGVLATLFALTIFLNSMWSISGQSVMLKSKYLTVTLRSVLTASRVVFLMVCHVLLLLIYLIVSGFDLSASGERGFVAIVSLGIGLVFAMFTAVSLHQIIMHLRHAWNYSDTVAKRDHEGQLLLEALVRRYLDMDRTIELYLQVCERGLAAAQRLDTLSSYRHLPHNGDAVDAAIAADDNLPSFSSFSGDGDQSGANSTNSSSLEGEPNRASATQSTNTSAAAAEEDEEGPEALTRFSPYPALTPKELPALSPTPPSATTTSRATARKTATTTAKASSKAPPRRTATYLSAAFRASSARSAASAESFSAASSSQQQQQKKCVGDPTAPLSALPRDVNYPAEAEFVTPVEGNPNWVSAPSQGVTGLVKAGDDAGPPTPNNGDKTSGDGRAAAARANTGAGTPLSLSDYAATAAGTAAGAASTKPSAGGAHAEDASDAIPAPTLLKASPDTFSGDFAEVQTPISQPPLKRSNSLLLSIRCLDPNYAAQAQTTRDELVEESRAVATAEYEKERKQSQQLSGARADRNKSTAVANKSSRSVDGAVSRVSGNEAKQPPQQRSANAPEAVVTIESLVPAVELDLATSFDPLAVPPLPLTRALSRLRPIQSSPLVAGSTAITATRESRRSLLADLQSDLESELRQIQAMPLRDSLLDVDLGQLASTPSLLHNVHPISFWAGTTALEPLGSASPLSGASKSRVNHTATGRGGAAQASGTTLFSSKSFPDENTNEAASASPLQRPGPDTRTHSGNPLLNADIATAAAAAPSTGSAASLKRKDAPMPRPGLASGDRSDDVPADSDAATSPPAVPPLPRFEAPRIHTHTSHRTVVEYMRRRAARACRAQRSRYGKQNVQRSRTPKAGVDIPRIPQDSKSLNSTDTKPRSE
ncbi:putative transmembrane protein [Leptomonas pyrrhocoris]|uniref:Putative transmembrane protein n=1 Tax=Leptomonas pyrrhocoris TaxID=157538 RepID=A0A0M9G2H4_LEPPY|nr:putative transmembrane protein [Leptomonas pyrrhocoris]KPA81025.1 putative transmembrane protein [Leptomonas pyrrhocoris]|eukprot:XP_015659464.1 putative transmembrane protein [Leptomonas pyrrhocoris]